MQAKEVYPVSPAKGHLRFQDLLLFFSNMTSIIGLESS